MQALVVVVLPFNQKIVGARAAAVHRKRKPIGHAGDILILRGRLGHARQRRRKLKRAERADRQILDRLQTHRRTQLPAIRLNQLARRLNLDRLVNLANDSIGFTDVITLAVTTTLLMLRLENPGASAVTV